MDVIRYLLILFVAGLSFFGLTLMVFALDGTLFVSELYLVLFLLIVVAIALYSISRSIHFGWLLLALVFATVLIDTFYLYSVTSASISLLVAVVVITAVGFILSVSFLRPKRRRHKPPIIIQDMPDDKPKQRKKATKKTAKKTVKGKTVKKKTTKKRAANTRKKTRTTRAA